MQRESSQKTGVTWQQIIAGQLVFVFIGALMLFSLVRENSAAVQWEWKWVWIGTLAGLVLYGFYSSISFLLKLGPPFTQRLYESLMEFIEVYRPILTPSRIVLISLTAGFGEEMVFRGIIQQIVGLWIASIIFAVMHIRPPKWWLLIYYLPMSFTFGYMLILTGSLWLCIITHIIYDLAALSFLYLFFKKQQGTQ